MSDPLVRNIVGTIGGPESTPGTAETREYVLPLRGMPTLRTAPEKVEDPIITGNNMSRGDITVAKNVSGGLPLTPRCCGGWGQILNAALGQESTPTQIGACIRIRYGGSDASCKISADTSADTLTSETGDLGSESGDSNFGTSGDIDLTDAATDTVGELVSVINAYSDYECEKLFGADAIDAADIVDITSAQGAGRWVYVWFSASGTGYYLHTFPVVLTNTLRPAYSVQLDEMQDDYLYDGLSVTRLAINAAIKGMVEADADCLAFEETTDGVTASALEIEDVDPLIFSQGGFSFGAYDFTHIRNIQLTMQNTMTSEGYGMGSLFRLYHKVPTFGLTGQMSLRYDTDLFGYRSRMFDDTLTGMSFYFKANTDFDTTNDIPQLMLVDVPFASLTMEPEENEGAMDIRLNIKGHNPDSQYGDPLTVYLITDDSGAY